MATQQTSTHRLATAARNVVVGASLVAGFLIGAGAASASTLIPAADTGGSGTHVSLAADAPTQNGRSIMLVESKEGPVSIAVFPIGHGALAF